MSPAGTLAKIKGRKKGEAVSVVEVTADARGRLPLTRAGVETGQRYRATLNEDGSITLTPVRSIPEHEFQYGDQPITYGETVPARHQFHGDEVMTYITLDDLENNLADIARRVERGEKIVVKEGGMEVSIGTAPGKLAIQPARRRGHIPTPDPSLAGLPSVDDIMREDRSR